MTDQPKGNDLKETIWSHDKRHLRNRTIHSKPDFVVMTEQTFK